MMITPEEIEEFKEAFNAILDAYKEASETITRLQIENVELMIGVKREEKNDAEKHPISRHTILNALPPELLTRSDKIEIALLEFLETIKKTI